MRGTTRESLTNLTACRSGLMESISGGPCDRLTIRVDAMLVTAGRVDKRQQIDSTLHGCSVARYSTCGLRFRSQAKRQPKQFGGQHKTTRGIATVWLCKESNLRIRTKRDLWIARVAQSGRRDCGIGNGGVRFGFFPQMRTKRVAWSNPAPAVSCEQRPSGRSSPAWIGGNIGPSRSTPSATVAVGPGACPSGEREALVVVYYNESP